VCDVSRGGEGVAEGGPTDPPLMHHGTAVRDNDFFVNYQVAYEARGGRRRDKTRLQISKALPPLPPPVGRGGRCCFLPGRVYA
jgi:hypothetical protein